MSSEVFCGPRIALSSMSLNKFTDVATGMDIALEIGCKDLVATGGVFKRKTIVEDMVSATPKGALTGATYEQGVGIHCGGLSEVLYVDANFNFYGKIEGAFVVVNNQNAIITASMGRLVSPSDFLAMQYTPGDPGLIISTSIGGVVVEVFNDGAPNPNYTRFKLSYTDAELSDTASSIVRLDMAEAVGDFVTIFDGPIVGIPQFETEGSMGVNGSVGNDVLITSISLETYESFVSKPSVNPSSGVTSLGNNYMNANTVETTISTLGTFYPVLGNILYNAGVSVNFAPDSLGMKYIGVTTERALVTWSMGVALETAISGEEFVNTVAAVFNENTEVIGSAVNWKSYNIIDRSTYISGSCLVQLQTGNVLGLNLKALDTFDLGPRNYIVKELSMCVTTLGAV